MSDINLDDLLKELEEAEARKDPSKVFNRTEKEVSRGIMDFITEKQVTAGEHKIPNFLIYQHYLDHKPHAAKVSKIEFFRQFNKLFTAKRSAKMRFYLLEPASFDLSDEYKDNAKRLDRNRMLQGKRS